MRREQLSVKPIHRRANSSGLCQNLRAIHPFLHHSANPAYLSLNPAEPVYQAFDLFLRPLLMARCAAIVGNVLFLILGGGALTAVGYAILGALLCVTIIGIPFGLQCFKLMKLCASPFGAEVF